ncbi:MAG: glutaredoxin [Candidatus Binatia bacterium]
MARVRIYTGVSCPYCVQAKRLLDRKERPVRGDRRHRRPATARRDDRSLRPSRYLIFIAEQSIGGFDELYELEQGGGLDALLHGA